MSEPLHGSPWRNLKYLAGIQELEMEWVKAKIDLPCSSVQKPASFCYSCEAWALLFWHWDVLKVLTKAQWNASGKVKEPPCFCADVGSLAACSGLLRHTRCSQQQGRLLLPWALCVPYSPLNCLSIWLRQQRHCGRPRVRFCSVLLEQPRIEKITSCRIQWIFPLPVLLDWAWQGWRENKRKRRLTSQKEPWFPWLQQLRTAVSLSKRRLVPQPRWVQSFIGKEVGFGVGVENSIWKSVSSDFRIVNASRCSYPYVSIFDRNVSTQWLFFAVSH